jgi:DNA-binding transcriptional ArsR family regulator
LTSFFVYWYSGCVELELVRDPERAACALQPIRRAILRELSTPDSATGLAKRIGLARQKVNYHLTELERHGYVVLHETRRKRNCVEQVMRRAAGTFVVSPDVIEPVASGLTGQDRYSAGALIRRALRSVRAVAALASKADQAGKRLATLSIFGEVRFKDAASQAAFAEEAAEALASIAERYQVPAVEPGRTFEFQFLCHPEYQETI